MREFILFIKFFAQYFWFCRTVLLFLIAIIGANGFLVAYLEDKSIFTSMYFILVTALTIGYGDITPETALGKIVSILSGIVGVVIMGLIIAISKLALENTVRAVNKDESPQ